MNSHKHNLLPSAPLFFQIMNSFFQITESYFSLMYFAIMPRYGAHDVTIVITKRERMFLPVIDTRYPVIRRPIEYIHASYNRQHQRIYRCVHVQSRICRLNAEKRVHFNRVIENQYGVEHSPGKFHGSENHGVALPPGRCSFSSPLYFYQSLMRVHVYVPIQGDST